MKFDSNGWLNEAIEIDYLEKSESRQGYKPTHLVLHGTAGGERAEDIATNIFQNPAYAASTHFVIGKDGHIVQGVPCSLAAWSNGFIASPRIPWNPNINPNLYCISIEHCKNQKNAAGQYDNSDPLTSLQQTSSFRLVKAICEEYGIPKRRADVHGGICEHADFDTVNRSHCPGPYPYDGLWPYLNGDSSMGVPLGWTDKDKTLTAPNGIPVILGFRDYILSHSWDAGNWPLAPEQGVPQLELSNPSLGAGTQQLFRTKMLGWTAERGVFEEWLGTELFVARRVLAALKTPPADIVALLTTLLGASEQLSTQIQAALKQLQGVS
jgi:hypothetical protein